MNELSVCLHALLSRSHLNRLSQSSGFIRRVRKFDGYTFLHSLFGGFGSPFFSLSEQAEEYSSIKGDTISKTAVFKKYGAASLKFVLSVLNEVLSVCLPPLFSLQSGPVKEILVKDSVHFKVDSRLKGSFKGVNSPAGASIQFEYDLLGGRTTDVEVLSDRYNDRRDALAKVSQLRSGVLYIRDLGYFCLEVFGRIAAAGAYFLSRLRSDVVLYADPQGRKRLFFSGIWTYLARHGCDIYEHGAYIPSMDTPCRVVCVMVPLQVYEGRVRGWKKEHPDLPLPRERRARMRLNIYLTNLQKEYLPAQDVYSLYRLRWQVELSFKTWKGVFHIQKKSDMNTFRFKTTLYARLIMVMVCRYIFFCRRTELWSREGIPLSLEKCMKSLSLHLRELREALRREDGDILALTEQWKLHCRLEKSRCEESSIKIMERMNRYFL